MYIYTCIYTYMRIYMYIYMYIYIYKPKGLCLKLRFIFYAGCLWSKVIHSFHKYLQSATMSQVRLLAGAKTKIPAPPPGG